MGTHTIPHSDTRIVLDSLRRIVHALRLFDRETEKRLGLSGAQVFVLEKLKEGGGISINELADLTHTHQSSVSVVVQKLAQSGLVHRSSSAKDGRRVELSLTKKEAKSLAQRHRPPRPVLFLFWQNSPGTAADYWANFSSIFSKKPALTVNRRIYFSKINALGVADN